MDGIDVSQERNRCSAFANEVINLRVPYNAGIFLTM
jgi:hypothetical protein